MLQGDLLHLQAQVVQHYLQAVSRTVYSTRTVLLTNKAPKEVLNLFTNIAEQLKAVFKNYNFQESQKRSLLEHKEKKYHQMRKAGMEIMERKKNDKNKLAHLKEQIAGLEHSH